MSCIVERPDGRTTGLQMRPLTVQLGLVKRADGSARVSHGLTSAIAVVLGPIEAPPGPKRSNSSCYFHVLVKPLAAAPLSGARAASSLAAANALSFNCNDSSVNNSLLAAAQAAAAVSGGSSSSASEGLRRLEGKLHALLKHLVEPGAYPRCLIQLTVMIQQHDGSAEEAAVNAAVAALIDAGVALRMRVWAVQLARLTFSHLQKQQYLLVDPCKEEEEQGRIATHICLVLEPRTGGLVSSFRPSSELGFSSSSNSLATTSAGIALSSSGIEWENRAPAEADFCPMLLAALSACRFIDTYVRAAVQQKLMLPLRTFANNNLWWTPAAERKKEEDF